MILNLVASSFMIVSPPTSYYKDFTNLEIVDGTNTGSAWNSVLSKTSGNEVLIKLLSCGYSSSYDFQLSVIGFTIVSRDEVLLGRYHFSGSDLANGAILSASIDAFGFDNTNIEFYRFSFENVVSGPTLYFANFLQLSIPSAPTSFVDFGEQTGQSLGYQNGYTAGKADGELIGYQNGYAAGTSESEYSVSWVSSVFNSVNDFLNLEPLPGFKLWYIFGIPLVIALVLGVLKFLR